MIDPRTWHEHTAALLRQAANVEVASPPRDPSTLRLTFRMHGLAYVAVGELRQKSFTLVLGLVDGAGPARAAPVYAEIRSRTRTDTAALRFGLQRGIKSGDDAFDERTWIETDATSAELAVWLSAPATRAAIASLLSVEGRTVRFGEYDCIATVSVGHTPSAAEVASVLGELSRLGTSMPGRNARPPFAEGGRLRGAGGSVVLVILAMLTWVWPAASSETLAPLTTDHTWPLLLGSVGLTFTLTAASWFKHRKRTTGFRLLALQAACFAAIVPSALFGAFFTLNGLAPSSEQDRTVFVEDRRCVRGSRGAPSCYAYVRLEDRSEVRIRDNDTSRSCGPAILTVRNGALNHAILVQLRPKADAPRVRCRSN